MKAICVLLALACAAAAQEGDDALTLKLKESCAAATKAIEDHLGPKFPGPVKVEWKTQAEIADFARRTAKELTPEGLLETATRLGVRLRQFPPGFDLLEKQIELLERNVAGIYDPAKDTFYVARETGMPGTPMFRITVAHELLHAYRDVDKDYWRRMVDAVQTDSDWTIGVQFLVEGDATLLGYVVGLSMQARVDFEAAMTAHLGNVRRMRRTMMASLARPEFAGFPPILKEMLVAPYAYGQDFAARVYQQGGLAALAAAYDRPPRSSEQVLHPEKYLADEPDEPVVFTGGDPTAALGEGWTLALSNVMGEFEMRVQFRETLGREAADRAAAGWDGCRYWFCVKDGEPDFVGMITTWDTDADAAEFAVAWARWAAGRDGARRSVRAVFDGLAPRGYDIATKEGAVVVRRRGRDVLVADAIPVGRADAVLAAMAGAKRAERAADARPAAR